MKKTIFSRRYDKEKELVVPEGAPKPELDSFEEFWRKCQETVVVPVPARLEGAKEFIRKIMEFSSCLVMTLILGSWTVKYRPK